MFLQVENITVTQTVTVTVTRLYETFIVLMIFLCYCRPCMDEEGPCEQKDKVPRFMRASVRPGDPAHEARDNTHWGGLPAAIPGLLGGTKNRKPKGKGQGKTSGKANIAKADKAAASVPSRPNTRASKRSSDGVSDAAPASIPSYISFPTWDAVMDKFADCVTFDELSDVVVELYREMPAMVKRSEFVDVHTGLDRQDTIAQVLIPDDIQRQADLFAIAVSPDGSCLPHAMSRLAYGHEGQVSEMRVRLVLEATMNLVQYTSHEMLLRGTYIHEDNVALQDCDMVQIYATRSGFGEAGVDYTNFENAQEVFQKEIMDIAQRGTYCGIWALHIMANVMMCPVVSVYPDVHTELLRERHEVHRLINPFNDVAAKYTPLTIMWSKSAANANSFQHFVPLVK